MNRPSSQLLGRVLKEHGIWSEDPALLGCVTPDWCLHLSVPLLPQL